MDTPIIQQRMTTYRQWKIRAARAAFDFDEWLKIHECATPQIHEQIQSILEDLRTDRLTLSMVQSAHAARLLLSADTGVTASGLDDLEEYLSAAMLESRHRHLRARMESTFGDLLDQNRSHLSARIQDIERQLQESRELRDKIDNVISQLLEKTRREQELYLRGIQQFHRNRETLIKETERCRRILEHGIVNTLIDRTHQDMLESWTTRGLTQSMKTLFGELRRGMQMIAADCARIRKTVRSNYGVYNEDYGFDLPVPDVFAPTRYRVQIDLLYQEVDAFTRSPTMAFSNQAVVINRFHERLVRRAASQFEQLRLTFHGWTRDTLQPLAEELEERKKLLDKRRENLQRISHSKENLQQRIDDLQSRCVELAKQLTALRNIHNSLRHDPQFEREPEEIPKATASAA